MDANDRLYRASEEAADWWALLQGEDLTREEREAFIDWLRDSKTNIAEMLRLAQVHGVLAQFQEWADISTVGPGSDADVIPLPPQRRPNPLGDARGKKPGAGPTMWRVALAGSVAAVALALLFILSPWRGQVIETERGERLEVALEDGTLLQVDPQTRLRVRFEKAIRRVVLTQGRAVFRVAKNPARPFIVEANDTSVRAVGTAFGVERREGNTVVVTVVEGKVAVTSSESKLVPAVIRTDATSGSVAPVYLTANQQVTMRTDIRSAPPVREVSSARELAWAEGRLVFRNDPVSKVIAEFNRYNRVQIYVPDAMLAARPVSGVFDAGNPEAFIAFMASATSVRIDRDEARSIVISPDSRVDSHDQR